MRQVLVVSLLLLFGWFPAVAAPEVEALSDTWAEARLSADAEAVRAALADGFTVVFADGRTGGAAALVAAIVEKSEPALALGSAEVAAAQVYDGAAILQGVYVYGDTVEETKWVNERRKAAGHTTVIKVEKTVTREVEARVRFTEFWVDDRGGLRLAMLQLTPVAD